MDQPTVNLADRPRRMASIRALSLLLATGFGALLLTGLFELWPPAWYIVLALGAVMVLGGALGSAAILARPLFELVEDHQNHRLARRIQLQNATTLQAQALAQNGQATNGQSVSTNDDDPGDDLRVIVGECARAGMTRMETIRFLYDLGPKDAAYRTATRRIDRACHLDGVHLAVQRGPNPLHRTFHITPDS